jgi:hypothetical protein
MNKECVMRIKSQSPVRDKMLVENVNSHKATVPLGTECKKTIHIVPDGTKKGGVCQFSTNSMSLTGHKNIEFRH